jgi:predicted nuclease of predicted toxin-antitoxin system
LNLPFPLLLDENVPEDLAPALQTSGMSVTTVAHEELRGRDDSEVIERARTNGSVVVTQDLGFGRLAMLQGARCPGIIILRPGHLERDVVLDTLNRLFANFPDVRPPFRIVVVRRGEELHIRARSLE